MVPPAECILPSEYAGTGSSAIAVSTNMKGKLAASRIMADILTAGVELDCDKVDHVIPGL